MSEEKKTEAAKIVDMETKTMNDMVVEVKGKEGRKYRFSMLFGSPLIEGYYAAVNAANEIANVIKEAIDKQKNKEEDEKKKEESK